MALFIAFKSGGLDFERGLRKRSLYVFFKNLKSNLISVRRTASALALASALSAPAFAQSPWVNAVEVLKGDFTGPIAKGLSLVSIVIGGLTFAFGEGDSKRMLAGIVFGVGMAIGAASFMIWLFP